MVRRVLSLMLVGGLAGCAASGPIALAGTSGCGFVTAMRMAMAGLPCMPKLPPAPYCTRSLGDVDCWTDPGRLPDRPPQVADGGWEAPALPRAPTSGGPTTGGVAPGGAAPGGASPGLGPLVLSLGLPEPADLHLDTLGRSTAGASRRTGRNQAPEPTAAATVSP